MIIICNLCFRQKSHSIVLFLTNCRHVFCESCLNQINNKCFVCSKIFEFLKIDSKMPEPLRRLFFPLDVELRRIKMIQQFQMEQIFYYVKRKAHIIPQINHLEKKWNDTRTDIQMVKKAIQRERAMIQKLNEFDKNVTPNLSKIQMTRNMVFDDSPEKFRRDKTKSQTDSGYHRM